jgi:hypothetical protein
VDSRWIRTSNGWGNDERRSKPSSTLLCCLWLSSWYQKRFLYCLYPECSGHGSAKTFVDAPCIVAVAPGPPKNAMFAVPPPSMFVVGRVVTWKVIVLTMSCFAIALRSTVFGSSRISCNTQMNDCTDDEGTEHQFALRFKRFVRM